MDDQIKLFVPGRLCLFGEHSDWAGLNRTINPEIVAGCAIVTGVEQGIYGTARKNEHFVVKSLLPEYEGREFDCEMDMMKLRAIAREGGFFSYVAGVASYMSEWYHVGGVEICIDRMTLPIKSGLSSSAAICVLVARAFNELYELHLNTLGLMNIAYWGEQRTPSQCGRLDQACAFGIRPVAMIFDGNELDVEPIEVKEPLYYVFADLMAGKDTVKILRDLNSAYPIPHDDKEKAVHEALGKDNKRITEAAKKYISEGDVEKLGALMEEAQSLFDEKVAPMCPDELTAPVLHSVLTDENLQKYIYGAKGVGSQGDGTVQFLAKDFESQRLLVEYLKNERKMPAYPLTLKPLEEDKKKDMFMGEFYIFGARSVAIGIIRAIRECYGGARIKGCVVSSLEDNPREIEGLRVQELKEFEAQFSDAEKQNVRILIATPVYVQEEISDTLRVFGFENLICIDSEMEEDLMRKYYTSKKLFPSLKDVTALSADAASATVIAVCHNADRRLRFNYVNAPWVKNIQVGAVLTDIKLHEMTDMTGENISDKNPVYCELTGLYWMWKNLIDERRAEEYFGLYHYRRVLDIDENDLKRISGADVDVVLPYPMIHVPNIKEHHTRYTHEAEWGLLLEAVRELAPEYMESYGEIFGGEYFYNYNMFLAKGKIVDELCGWMFPVFFRLEELCKRSGIVPAKRYIAYFGESMMTWFFMKNANRWKMLHTGRILRI